MRDAAPELGFTEECDLAGFDLGFAADSLTKDFIRSSVWGKTAEKLPCQFEA